MQILENMERLSDFCNPKQGGKKKKKKKILENRENKQFHEEPKIPKQKESKPKSNLNLSKKKKKKKKKKTKKSKISYPNLKKMEKKISELVPTI